METNQETVKVEASLGDLKDEYEVKPEEEPKEMTEPVKHAFQDELLATGLVNRDFNPKVFEIQTRIREYKEKLADAEAEPETPQKQEAVRNWKQRIAMEEKELRSIHPESRKEGKKQVTKFFKNIIKDVQTKSNKELKETGASWTEVKEVCERFNDRSDEGTIYLCMDGTAWTQGLEKPDTPSGKDILEIDVSERFGSAKGFSESAKNHNLSQFDYAIITGLIDRR